MFNITDHWRTQVQTAHDMGLTVANWEDMDVYCNHALYGWARPFLKDALDTALVAPILATAIGYKLTKDPHVSTL